MKIRLWLLILLFFNCGYLFPQEKVKSTVSRAIYFDLSPPFKELQNLKPKPADNSWRDGAVKNFFDFRKMQYPEQSIKDDVVQDYFGQVASDSILQDFEGTPNVNTFTPPDPFGDVGPGYYVQIVNLSFAVYSKAGVMFLGPLQTSLIWNGLPNNANNGDGVVLYDEQADRWFISQFSFPNDLAGPFYQMIAVSQTPDPTGSWYRWEYQFTEVPDYPKFGIWIDGYYMSCNRFSANTLIFKGPGALVFDRSAMLAGNADARMVMFTLSPSGSFRTLLPSDCDGPFPQPGTPEYFTYIDFTYLGIYDFHVNWVNPANSTFGNFRQLPVAPFSNSVVGISQPGTSQKLHPLSDRLMYRLQFRSFTDHQSMVVNHSVSVGYHFGIRWYELWQTTGDWFVYQQSTYSPDTTNRWMGSIAMDSSGNIALGYSVSSSVMYPSICYTGRMKHDPLGQMTIAEKMIRQGTGSQTGNWSGLGRWGDYSSMTVDPVQPGTFWYTQEYYANTSWNGWQTRIASFAFSGVLSIHAYANPTSVCHSGSTRLNVDVYGVTGNSSYSWTSIPPGFVSALKDPVVSPISTTKYIVEVTNNTQSRTDTVLITVIPESSVFGGNDTTYCSNVTQFQVKGSAVNYIYVKWVTSGDGTFTDPFSLHTTYYPGSRDKSGGSVNLKLMAYPQPPCNAISGTRHIEFKPCK